MKSRLQQTPVVVALALVSCALWGSAFPCIKKGYVLFAISSSDIPSQILFAGYRFLFAGILAITIGSIASRKLLLPNKLSSLIRIVCLSSLQTVMQYVLFYIALAHTTGIKSAILESSNIFFSILIAGLLFRMEKLSAGKLIGCLIGFIGIILVNLPAQGGLAGIFSMNFTLKGEGFLLLSTIAAAFAAVLIRLFSRYENPVLLSGWQFLFGGALMIAAGYVAGGHIAVTSAKAGSLLMYLSFLSAAAYTIWSLLLKYNDVSRVTIFGFMNPVFGVILSALILGEGGTLASWKVPAALLLVSIGIVVVNRQQAQ